MKAFATTLALFGSLSSLVHAQEGTIIDPSKLPQCALSCNLLTSAQSLCVPPVAPANGQASYQTCFCNSNFLVNYKAGSAAGVCDAECTSDADRQQILQWYTGLCNGGTVVIPAGNGDATANTGGGAETVGDSPAATTTSAAVGSRPSSGPHKSWISGHYQWVIMIVVLLLAAVGFTILGIWLKRRHDRKWATGGFARDSMLRTNDVVSSLGNRHPDPSTLSMSQVAMAGPSSRPATLSKKGPTSGVRNVS